jgi:hypothetical protein
MLREGGLGHGGGFGTWSPHLHSRDRRWGFDVNTQCLERAICFSALLPLQSNMEIILSLLITQTAAGARRFK